MRSRFINVIFQLALGIAYFPLRIEAFVGSRNSAERESRSILVSSLLRPEPVPACNIALQGTKTEDDTSSSNVAFAMLSTDRDNKPNQGNFFYNDEVISHLYGYMYLVGFFVAQDGLFLGSFFAASSIAAWATQQELLPCNPRIPAIAAALTLASTLFLRYVVGFEPPLESILGESYQGPTESSAIFELAICLLNIGWGFFGSWRTKEQVNGATYGF